MPAHRPSRVSGKVLPLEAGRSEALLILLRDLAVLTDTEFDHARVKQSLENAAGGGREPMEMLVDAGARSGLRVVAGRGRKL